MGTVLDRRRFHYSEKSLFMAFMQSWVYMVSGHKYVLIPVADRGGDDYQEYLVDRYNKRLAKEESKHGIEVLLCYIRRAFNASLRRGYICDNNEYIDAMREIECDILLFWKLKNVDENDKRKFSTDLMETFRVQ
jgi:hypothetical protein